MAKSKRIKVGEVVAKVVFNHDDKVGRIRFKNVADMDTDKVAEDIQKVISESEALLKEMKYELSGSNLDKKEATEKKPKTEKKVKKKAVEKVAKEKVETKKNEPSDEDLEDIEKELENEVFNSDDEEEE